MYSCIRSLLGDFKPTLKIECKSSPSRPKTKPKVVPNQNPSPIGPELNLIKDKIPIPGLDIVERRSS